MRSLFPLGKVVCTPGAWDLLSEHPEYAAGLLDRHASGDWGEVCAEDARENERSLKYGFRVFTVYRLGKDGSKVWIITEADRSSTCMLTPSEY